MNEGELNTQIQQMVCFTRHQAEEKADEISASSEEVFVSTTYSFLTFYGEAHSLENSVIVFQHFRLHLRINKCGSLADITG